MLATLDHGDTVLVPNPSTPFIFTARWLPGLRYAQCRCGRCRFLQRTGARHSWKLSEPKMMILGFPSNPTAQCVELDSSKRLWHWRNATMCWWSMTCLCRYRLRWLESAVNHAGAGARDVAVEFFTLSKSYNMAGCVSALWLATKRWSARWHVLKVSRLRHLYAVAGGGDCGAGGDQQCVRDIAEQYKRRRDVLVKGCMKRAGWSKCRRLRCMSGENTGTVCCHGLAGICQEIANEAKVCVSPGIGFGDYGDTQCALHWLKTATVFVRRFVGLSDVPCRRFTTRQQQTYSRKRE